MKDIVILGSSGFAKEVLWILEDINEVEQNWNILGFIDSSLSGDTIDGYAVIGDDNWLINYPHPIHAVTGLGSPKLRRRVIEKYQMVGKNISFPSIVSPYAHCSRYAKMGVGSIVCGGTHVSSGVKIGDFSILNLNCTVGHDAMIHDFVTVNPGTNISGNVTIFRDCDIGTGTRIIQGKQIGPESVVGAGSVIIRDVPGNCTVVGNPGRILER